MTGQESTLKLFISPPSNCDDRFSWYDQWLPDVADKHAPLVMKVERGRCSESWYSAERREVKKEIFPVEKIYRIQKHRNSTDNGANNLTRNASMPSGPRLLLEGGHWQLYGHAQSMAESWKSQSRYSDGWGTFSGFTQGTFHGQDWYNTCFYCERVINISNYSCGASSTYLRKSPTMKCLPWFWQRLISPALRILHRHRSSNRSLKSYQQML